MTPDAPFSVLDHPKKPKPKPQPLSVLTPEGDQRLEFQQKAEKAGEEFDAKRLNPDEHYQGPQDHSSGVDRLHKLKAKLIKQGEALKAEGKSLAVIHQRIKAVDKQLVAKHRAANTPSEYMNLGGKTGLYTPEEVRQFTQGVGKESDKPEGEETDYSNPNGTGFGGESFEKRHPQTAQDLKGMLADPSGNKGLSAERMAEQITDAGHAIKSAIGVDPLQSLGLESLPTLAKKVTLDTFDAALNWNSKEGPKAIGTLANDPVDIAKSMASTVGNFFQHPTPQGFFDSAAILLPFGIKGAHILAKIPKSVLGSVIDVDAAARGVESEGHMPPDFWKNYKPEDTSTAPGAVEQEAVDQFDVTWRPKAKAEPTPAPEVKAEPIKEEAKPAEVSQPKSTMGKPFEQAAGKTHAGRSEEPPKEEPTASEPPKEQPKTAPKPKEEPPKAPTAPVIVKNKTRPGSAMQTLVQNVHAKSPAMARTLANIYNAPELLAATPFSPYSTIITAVAPHILSPEGMATGSILRAFYIGPLNQARLIAKSLNDLRVDTNFEVKGVKPNMVKVSDLFKDMTDLDRAHFTDAMEGKGELASPALRDLARTLRNVIDQNEQRLIQGGLLKEPEVLGLYFPRSDYVLDHSVNEPGTRSSAGAGGTMDSGKKGFLLQRALESQTAGVEKGLELKWKNPAEMVAHIVLQTEKAIGAKTVLDMMDQQGTGGWYRVGSKDVPLGWARPTKSMNVLTKFGPRTLKFQKIVDGVLDDKMRDFLGKIGVKVKDVEATGQQYGNYNEGTSSLNISKTSSTPQLAHEFGHALDHKFKLGERLAGEFKNPKKLDSQLQHWAEKRERDPGSDAEFHDYVSNDAEKVGNAVRAYIYHGAEMASETPELYKALRKTFASDEQLEWLNETKPSLVDQGKEVEFKVFGQRIMANYYMDPSSAAIFDNIFPPDALNDLARGTGLARFQGIWNAYNLGLSAYHATFTAKSAAAVDLATGLEKLMNRDPEGIKQVLRSQVPFLSAQAMYKAGKAIKADYMNRLSDTPVVRGITGSGGRFGSQDFGYMSALHDTWAEAFKKKGVWGVMGKTTASVMHGMSAAILEKMVPNVKFGAFAAYFDNLTRDGHEATLAEVQKLWDHIDNVFGEMVYDNLFIEKSLRMGAHQMVRALGWNIGSGRLLAKGAMEAATLKSGYSSSFIMATAFNEAMSNTMIQYLATRQLPTSMKDLYAPKIGDTDSDGDERRIMQPGYLGQWIGMVNDPRGALANKASPLAGLAAHTLMNADFNGKHIWQASDGWDSFAKWGRYAGSQLFPFSLQSIARNWSGEGLESIQKNFLQGAAAIGGMQQAPKYMTRSDAGNFLAEIASDNSPIGTAPGKNQTSPTTYEHQANILAASGDQESAERIYKKGHPDATDQDLEEWYRDRRDMNVSPLYVRFKQTPGLTGNQALQFYDKLTNKEKEQGAGMDGTLGEFVLQKIRNNMAKIKPEDLADFEKRHPEAKDYLEG
jgi:hypothetical protein